MANSTQPSLPDNIIDRMLGASAAYFNADLNEKRLNNITNILLKTQEKFSGVALNDLQMPPKLVRSLINEGSFIDDKVAVDYFAGILASSNTAVSQNDQGAFFMKLIDKLSCYQLRTHFLTYGTMKEKFKNYPLEFPYEDCDKMELFLPIFFYGKSMKFMKKEMNQLNSLMQHSYEGLADANLIDKNFHYGFSDYHYHLKGLDFEGIICQPTQLGIQFFLWAFGAGNEPLEFFFNKNFKAKIKGLPNQIPYTFYTE
jgi:hypothetical protein